MSDKPTGRAIISSATDELHNNGIMVDGREIFLNGYIDNVDENPGTDWRMAGRFIKNIRFLEHLNDKPIIVHQQNNVGGDWDAGMSIYDAIKQCKLYVVVITHGLASSMGSIIPQAGDKRITMPSCTWLIHQGTTDIGPHMTRQQADSWINHEKRLDSKMLDIFSDVCSSGNKFKDKTTKFIRSTIKKHMNNRSDWLLSSEEALEYGFCDGIYGESPYENMSKIKDLGYKK